jgi:predicted metal-dependent phosphoesterase TrpH
VGTADLHIHTSDSDGLASVDQVLRYAETKTDLDLIAITDHDTIEGALRARDQAVRDGYRFQVIVGCEVTTRQGHLLALFLERPVRSLRSVEETVAAVHAQGGICIAPHPLSWLTRSLGARAIRRVQASPTEGVYLDGFETWNPSLAGRVTRKRVIELNEEYRLATTGGSDAHFLAHLGTAYTVFPGLTPEELRTSLLARTVEAVRADPRPEHAVSVSELARQQVKSLVELPCRRVAAFLHRQIGSRPAGSRVG